MNDTGSKVSDSIAEDLAAQIVGEVTTAEREWEKSIRNSQGGLVVKLSWALDWES